MAKALSVRLRGRHIGILAQDPEGRLSFRYDNAWMGAAGTQPISQSLPLADTAFGDRAVKAYFGGYLPDDQEARVQISAYFGISANSMFQLLGAVGRDCAGALSLHAVDEPTVVDTNRKATYTALDEVALASVLRELERRPLLAGPGRLRLSLAGAQSKTAVYLDEDGQVALTKDDYPSTHIIKPALRPEFEDLELIEYVCLELGRRVGLRVPAVRYGHAQGTPYLLVERYDRRRTTDGAVERLHQEDFCQALGVVSDRKYEREGGPGLLQCFALCDGMRLPAVERLRLLDVVVFNFLIGNAGAHGKNFSVLYGPGGAELAPLYDVVSTLVFEADQSLDMDARMAMRIGRSYDGELVRPSDWRDMAEQTGFTWPAIRSRIESLSRALLREAPLLEEALVGHVPVTPILARAVKLILGRVHRIRSTHGLDAVSPAALSRRPELSGGGQGATRQALQHEAELEFARRYRRFMTRLWREGRRARLGGEGAEQARLDALARALTAAQAEWQASTASEEQRALLCAHLSPLPGDGAEPSDAT